jgi:NADH:ubiquinone oxidoreductase subunit D
MRSNLTERRVKSFVLNFGPQHPASHGVLRLILQLNGELIERADPHIGFLHRGTEKLIETKTYLQALPYFDRLDYVSMMAQEHAFCLGIESLLKTTSYTSAYVQIRVLFDELTRLLNHFLAISTHSLDVGNMTPLLWAFEERESLMEFYERVSGARMHAAFYRPNDVDWSGINYQFFLDVALFARDCFKSLTEIFSTLTSNRIWKTRLVNIGNVSYNEALAYGATGVTLRSTGFKKDLRFLRSDTYSYYWYLTIKGFVGKRGDSYDRFLIRIREMYESVNIIFQLISNLVTSFQNYKQLNKTTRQFGFLNFLNNVYPLYATKLNKNTKYTSMEALIEHFKYYSEGLKVPTGFAYQAVEAPKGEFGVSLISDGTAQPYRCKIRTPAFQHLNLLQRMVQGHFFADMITVLGSQDIVFGEVDR